jgi:hypothetical protein
MLEKFSSTLLITKSTQITLVYQFVPVVFFCAVPALLSTFFVRRLLSGHHAKST